MQISVAVKVLVATCGDSYVNHEIRMRISWFVYEPSEPSARVQMNRSLFAGVGVNPSVETSSNWHTRHGINLTSQTTTLVSESSLAGEAEASAAGEQLTKE